MIDHDLAVELDALAAAIARLRPPQNHNPHAFHEDRSELASRARAIAQRCRSTRAPKPVIDEPPAPIGRQSVRHETMMFGGKLIVVEKRRAHDAAEMTCRCPDWGPDGIACVGLKPRATACRLYIRQQGELREKRLGPGVR